MPTIHIAGREVLYDAEDADIVESAGWLLCRSGEIFYVRRRAYSPQGAQIGYEHLHRMIANCPEGYFVDHINGNGLDNRRSNLRICTHAENMRNRRIHRNNKSGYKGVYFDPSRGGRWRAQIRAKGKKHCLGSFDSPESAYKAYLAASKALHGSFARAA